MFLGRVLLGLGIIFLALSWFIANQKIPDGISNPWTVKVVYSVMEINNFLLGRALAFGLVSDKWDAINSIIALRNKYGSQNTDMDTQIEDVTFDGVSVRLYQPTKAPVENRRAIVYFHGGGWCIGNAAMYDDLTSYFSKHLDAVVISVNYRLAPRHKFPAAFEDCITVVNYILENARKHHVDVNRIAVAGDSAGGNLAAAVSMVPKFRGKLKLQLLIYPALQAIDLKSPSYQDGSSAILPKRLMAEFYSNYAVGDASLVDILLKNGHTSAAAKKLYSSKGGILSYDNLPKEYTDLPSISPSKEENNSTLWAKIEPVFTNAFFAPLLAKTLDGLPPALVLTCQQDVLRDDGFWYVKRLKEFGNDVTHIHVNSGFHGLFNTPSLDLYREVRDQLIDYLVKLF